MLVAVDYGKGVIAGGDIASAAHGRVLKGCKIFSLVLKKMIKFSGRRRWWPWPWRWPWRWRRCAVSRCEAVAVVCGGGGGCYGVDGSGGGGGGGGVGVGGTEP